MHRALVATLALSLWGAASGCYTSVQIDSEPPRPDSEVVLELTDEGAESLGGLLGRGVVSATGRTLEWTADTVALAMVATTNARGREQLWQGERVAIPRQVVARVRERALDRRRTALALAGGIAAALLVQSVSGTNSGTLPNHGPIAPPGR